jgi:hypothetical protein
MVRSSDDTMVARYQIDTIPGDSILHKLGCGMTIEICSQLSDILIGKSVVGRCVRCRCNCHAKGAFSDARVFLGTVGSGTKKALF